MDKPNLFDFDDYREFLCAYVMYRKTKSHYFSVRGWTERLEIKSPSTLNMILNKKRHIGSQLIPIFHKYFNFTPEQRSYFEDLIFLNKNTEKNSSMMIFLKSSSEEGGKVSVPVFAIWEAHAIRELSLFSNFLPNGEWIAKKIKTDLSIEELDALLLRMVEEGYLKKDYTVTNKMITPSQKISKHHIKRLHTHLMKLSTKSIRDDIETRALHSTTLSIKKEKLQEAKSLIRDFQKKFCQLVEEQPGDDVYQFNIQLFSLLRNE